MPVYVPTSVVYRRVAGESHRVLDGHVGIRRSYGTFERKNNSNVGWCGTSCQLYNRCSEKKTTRLVPSGIATPWSHSKSRVRIWLVLHHKTLGEIDREDVLIVFTNTNDHHTTQG